MLAEAKEIAPAAAIANRVGRCNTRIMRQPTAYG
jgi:hypothetical protein